VSRPRSNVFNPPVHLESTLDVRSRAESPSFETVSLPTTLNGRYVITELLGTGGMGVVFRATDLVSRREVALKMLRGPNATSSSLALFKAEFMTLATLSHPNIAAVYDFARCRDSAAHFFTMELVTGRGALAATQNATFDQVLGLVLQVLRALSYLHARGVVHFDLKPANMLIMADGRVRLLDFGIARSAHSSACGRYATPAFMAPELRSEGAEVDRRADLYSLGVTWFQLLFRRLPQARAASAADDECAAGEFELSAEEETNVPGWLPAVLRRLLERDPARRYRTANEVIAVLNRVRDVADVIETPETSDSYVATAALVGRGHAFQELFGHVQRRARLGRQGPLAALCIGPSGSGKSRLLREVRYQCQTARYFVLESRCDAEASGPYAAWNEIITQAASPRPRREAMSSDALADGVVQLLMALSTPSVVILDDLQWMDAMSLELLELVLERLATRQREEAVPVAFLLSSREEMSSSCDAMLKHLRDARALLEVALDPLDPLEVRELVESMLGASELTSGLAQALTDATGGNALLVAEVLRAWVRDGRLSAQAAGWTFRVDPCATELAREVRGLFRERVRELVPLQFRTLCVLALLRRPLALGLLSTVLESDPDSTLEAVTELRRRNLVFLSAEESVQVTTEHWSDAANAMMDAESRTTLHLRLAEAFETSGDTASAALHYQRAAKFAAAAEQYARAAEQCYERGALSHVLEYAEKSAECGASAEMLGRLCSLAAEAARLRGDGRAEGFAQRALGLLPVGSSDWLRASRVAIAVFNPLAKGA